MGSGAGKTIRRLSSRIKVEPQADRCDSVAPTAASDAAATPKGSTVARESHKSTAEMTGKTSLKSAGHSVEGKMSVNGTGAQGKPFPKRPIGSKLSKEVWGKLEEIFHKMDPDGSDAVTKEEARLFFKGAFGKLSADAMFNEVDVDGSGAITAEEFISFWVHVAKSGYKEADLLEELEELKNGEAWVDWKDGKETGAEKPVTFPSRPLLCRLSKKTWNKCKELFEKMDTDGALTINKDKAIKFMSKAANKDETSKFTKVSVDAMFNEIDPKHHGQIPAKEWMKFWMQVKSSGYKEADINDELDNLLQGGTWVDWKDGRSTA